MPSFTRHPVATTGGMRVVSCFRVIALVDRGKLRTAAKTCHRFKSFKTLASFIKSRVTVIGVENPSAVWALHL